MTEVWDLWFPASGASGLSFARTTVDAAVAQERVLVHAAPPVLDIVVRDEAGAEVASAKGLTRAGSGPMSQVIRASGRLRLEEIWPGPDDEGCLVILPGGEAGILTSWWHADDHSEWRWQVEFSNQVPK